MLNLQSENSTIVTMPRPSSSSSPSVRTTWRVSPKARHREKREDHTTKVRSGCLEDQRRSRWTRVPTVCPMVNAEHSITAGRGTLLQFEYVRLASPDPFFSPSHTSSPSEGFDPTPRRGSRSIASRGRPRSPSNRPADGCSFFERMTTLKNKASW